MSIIERTDINSNKSKFIEELKSLALKILGYKESKNLSYAKLIEELPEVGSDKTLNLLAKGHVAGLDVATWLEEYTIACAQIDSVLEPGENTETESNQKDGLLSDTTVAMKLRAMFTRLMRITDTNRLGILCIDGGGGKTSAAQALQNKWKSRVRRFQCLRVWDDTTSAMLQDLCDLMGIKEVPISRHARYRAVRDKLRAKRTGLIFDEAHYMGPECLSCVVNLMNDTPGEFIFLAKPLLWKKLERTAYEECDQLKVNRLDELAKYDRLDVKDYEKFLRSRLPGMSEEDLERAKEALASEASARGHLAFARDAIRGALELAKGKPVTLEHLRTASADVARKLGKSAE